MNATAQNGWPVVTAAACDQGPFLGVKFPNGILHGPVASIAVWQLRRYVATVEPLHPGQCWGFDAKRIEGSSEWSNHAAGCAWDINAEHHPMGTSPGHSFTGGQIAACRSIVRASDGVLRWGGDYTHRPDPMHWEIVASRGATMAFAHKITGSQADLALGDVGTNVRALQRACDLVPNTGPSIAADGWFGPHTEAKVMHVQSHFGIASDGVAGPVTRAKLGLR